MLENHGEDTALIISSERIGSPEALDIHGQDRGWCGSEDCLERPAVNVRECFV
jgi:hypothetical protein